jgi:hypothetical protein
MDDKRDLLRHALATLKYRLKKACDGAPDGFGTFEAGQGVRKPVEILHHINDLLRYMQDRFKGGATRVLQLKDFAAELTEFEANVAALDHAMNEFPLRGIIGGKPATEEILLQGPLIDAMTHVGQIALLRRLAGSPVPAESFTKADIRAGR